MSEAHAEIKRVEPNSGFVREPNADSILITDKQAVTSNALEMAALAMTAVLGAIRISAIATTISDWGWVWLFAMGCLLAIWRVIVAIRSKSVQVQFGADRLLFARGGTDEGTIPYSDIRSIRIRKGPVEKWLEIVRKDGTSRSWSLNQIFSNRDTLELKLVQALGPRLASGVEFSRGVRPPEPLLGLAYDHFFLPPPVAMQPGVQYRYRTPKELRHFLWNGTGRSGWRVVFFGLLAPGVTDVLTKGDFSSLGFATLAYIAGLIVFIPWLLPKLQFAASLDDRFRLLPDGLEVNRRNQTWVVPLVEPRRSLSPKINFLYGHPKKYVGENGTYYFDPRFIEPDV